MPLGILSDEDFFKDFGSDVEEKKKVQKEKVIKDGEIKHPQDEPQVDIVGINKPGRKEGDVNVPDSLRKIIGETHVIDGRESALNLARQFGISSSSVSAYANGATGTDSYHTPKPSIIDHINKSRRRIIKRASAVLNQSLDAISQEKLDNAEPDKLSGIAKDMSAIIKNMEPKNEAGDGNSQSTPQFVIFAPQFRDERSFESITVNE